MRKFGAKLTSKWFLKWLTRWCSLKWCVSKTSFIHSLSAHIRSQSLSLQIFNLSFHVPSCLREGIFARLLLYLRLYRNKDKNDSVRLWREAKTKYISGCCYHAESLILKECLNSLYLKLTLQHTLSWRVISRRPISYFCSSIWILELSAFYLSLFHAVLSPALLSSAKVRALSKDLWQMWAEKI